MDDVAEKMRAGKAPYAAGRIGIELPQTLARRNEQCCAPPPRVVELCHLALPTSVTAEITPSVHFPQDAGAIYLPRGPRHLSATIDPPSLSRRRARAIVPEEKHDHQSRRPAARRNPERIHRRRIGRLQGRPQPVPGRCANQRQESRDIWVARRFYAD